MQKGGSGGGCGWGAADVSVDVSLGYGCHSGRNATGARPLTSAFTATANCPVAPCVGRGRGGGICCSCWKSGSSVGPATSFETHAAVGAGMGAESTTGTGCGGAGAGARYTGVHAGMAHGCCCCCGGCCCCDTRWSDKGGRGGSARCAMGIGCGTGAGTGCGLAARRRVGPAYGPLEFVVAVLDGVVAVAVLLLVVEVVGPVYILGGGMRVRARGGPAGATVTTVPECVPAGQTSGSRTRPGPSVARRPTPRPSVSASCGSDCACARHECRSVRHCSSLIIGRSFSVANVYTWFVSLAMISSACAQTRLALAERDVPLVLVRQVPDRDLPPLPLLRPVLRRVLLRPVLRCVLCCARRHARRPAQPHRTLHSLVSGLACWWWLRQNACVARHRPRGLGPLGERRAQVGCTGCGREHGGCKRQAQVGPGAQRWCDPALGLVGHQMENR